MADEEAIVIARTTLVFLLCTFMPRILKTHRIPIDRKSFQHIRRERLTRQDLCATNLPGLR